MKYIEAVHQFYHLQGVATDGRYMYWSFTDSLVQTSLQGTVLRQVRVHGGHLGDITCHNGRIYGSLVGNSLAGKPWGVWTSFAVHVWDAETLAFLDIIRLDRCYADYQNRYCGFNGIDGITFGTDPDTGEEVLLTACALFTDPAYSRQMILQFSPDGQPQKEHFIETGNTVFGIQNLAREPDTGNYWFTTYESSEPYQPKDRLYCVAPDLHTILASYPFSSPYGFICRGGGRFYATLQAGRNGDRSGYVYEADAACFARGGAEDALTQNIRAAFDPVMGL